MSLKVLPVRRSFSYNTARDVLAAVVYSQDCNFIGS